MSVTVENLGMRRFGGEGGDPFEFNLINKEGNTISIKHGKYVDAIVVNGKNYGGSGGVQTRTIKLEKGEFIEEMEIRSGKYVDYLSIKTSKGKFIEGGGSGGDQTKKVSNVVGIGGRAGGYLDRIDLLSV